MKNDNGRRRFLKLGAAAIGMTSAGFTPVSVINERSLGEFTGDEVFDFDKKWWTFRAQCIRVYDGDTITVNFDLGFYQYFEHQRIRLWGMDTPEMNDRDQTQRARAMAARDYLRGLILDSDIVVKTHGLEQTFNRWIGEVFVKVGDGSIINVNEQMIKTGHAVIRYRD